jgi:hypothetical protein
MDLYGIPTLAVGLGVACVGVVGMRKIRQLRRTGVRRVGTVVRHQRETDDGPLYSPVITFVDEYGAERLFTAYIRISWRIHRIGEEVPVNYPPGRPDAAQLSSFKHDALKVGLPLGFGVMFVVSGLIWILHG